jgi:hypothetical protein
VNLLIHAGATPANPAKKKIHKELKIMAQQNRSNNSNQLLVPGAQQALEQMKYEIATEFGVNLGPDTTSRANGSVGGEITKRLVALAQQQIGGFQQQ